ncbi:hypothetical protein [Streptomyces sp. NPDC051219]|uniref:hypothetical protein n=1 Tax=Streptomyces sp. NPDC051219 TaxID=3155283 RepID=UPI00342DE3C9
MLFAIDAPWNKPEEVVNYIREVSPQHTIDVHNGMLSPAGEMLCGKTIETLTKPEHAHLAVSAATSRFDPRSRDLTAAGQRAN